MLDTITRADVLDLAIRRVNEEIDELFGQVLSVPEDTSCQLHKAMRYAATGGKRFRPLLVIASAGLFGVPREQALRAGLAVECIHVQSLVHDDLPCMDNDDLRRGWPTVHRAFDEATAVLAGDALLALAFQLLASEDTHADPEIRAQLVLKLAAAIGPSGMAAGQMLDLTATSEVSLNDVMRLQRLKTGALIGWCLEAGGIMGDARPEQRTALRGYAQCLGLAFQIADDLLDVEGDEAKVGKRLRKDKSKGRKTFVTLLGVEGARQQARLLASQAVDHLKTFRGNTELLAEIARFAVRREV